MILFEFVAILHNESQHSCMQPENETNFITFFIIFKGFGKKILRIASNCNRIFKLVLSKAETLLSDCWFYT